LLGISDTDLTYAARAPRSESIDINDRLRKGLRRLLRQVVAGTFDQVMRIRPRELSRIGSTVWMRRTIGVALKRDTRHCDYRTGGESPLQVVILRFAISKIDAPTLVMNHDIDVIWIGKGRRRAIVSNANSGECTPITTNP
jgi:hypothetical protein